MRVKPVLLHTVCLCCLVALKRARSRVEPESVGFLVQVDTLVCEMPRIGNDTNDVF